MKKSGTQTVQNSGPFRRTFGVGIRAAPNIRWEISVSPDSNADVTVELPATEDCDAQGAICTEDDTMLSSPLEFTVKGPPLTTMCSRWREAR